MKKLTSLYAISISIFAATAALGDTLSNTPAASAPIVQTAPPGTNANPQALAFGVSEVVKMYQGGISKEIIVSYINNSSLPFHLTADNIIYLKDLGLPQEVTSALIARDGQLQRENSAAYQQAAAIQQQEQATAASAAANAAAGQAAAAQVPPPVVMPNAPAPQVPPYPPDLGATVVGAPPVVYPDYYPYGYPYYGPDVVIAGGWGWGWGPHGWGWGWGPGRGGFDHGGWGHGGGGFGHGGGHR